MSFACSILNLLFVKSTTYIVILKNDIDTTPNGDLKSKYHQMVSN